MEPVAESSGKWKLTAALAVLLGVSVTLFGPAFYEFFLRQPALVFAGAVVAFIVYLPSLLVARHLDQRPFAWPVYLFAILLVVAMSPVTSHITTLVTARGVSLWKVVGSTEEISKMLPVLLLAACIPQLIRNRRDGLVIGALAGLGFAIIEYAVGFALDNFPERGWADLWTTLPARWALGTHAHIIWAGATGGAIGYLREEPLNLKRLCIGLGIILIVVLTHGAQDFLGKYIAPLSIGLLGNLLLSLGVPESLFGDNSPLLPVLLIFGATINTVLINIPVFAILWWLIRHGPPRSNADASTMSE